MTTTPMKLEDVVREKMKEVIGDLIPEEQWDAIIKNEHQKFIREDLPKLIRAELGERFKEVIKEELSKPEWQSTWEDGREQAPIKIKEMLIEAAPLVLTNMIAGACQQTLYNFQSQLNSQGIY